MNYSENEGGLVITCKCGGQMWRFTIDAINSVGPKGEHQRYDEYRCANCKHTINIFKTI